VCEPVIPKCGPIVTWHWAHTVCDCDPWTEPETEWHLQWKRLAFESEVVFRRDGQCHRADIRTATGVVVELQHAYLDLPSIQARERFYDRMVWLYRVTWEDRLHFGRRGFWWKHGSKAMALSARTLFWDVEGPEIWKVSLGLVENELGNTRVLGRIVTVIARPRFEHWIAGSMTRERVGKG
jgi:hypothetical protein